jgi:hypothetical protein
LPHLANVALDEVERVADELWLRVRVRAERVSCPRCLAGSSRVHGRYRRRLIDTALGGLRVVVELVVRRFRCAEPGCAVVTLPAATRPSATTCARCARPAAPRPRRPRHRRSAQCPAGSSPTPTRLDADDTAALKKILERSPPLAATAAHVTGFAEMSRPTTSPTCTASPTACAATTPPSSPDSPNPTAPASSKATSTASKRSKTGVRPRQLRPTPQTRPTRQMIKAGVGRITRSAPDPQQAAIATRGTSPLRPRATSMGIRRGRCGVSREPFKAEIYGC